MSVPFHQVTFYKPSYFPAYTNVYAIVKTKNRVLAPTFIDKMYHTIPVRRFQHQSQRDNCILAFVCKTHATNYLKEFNKIITPLFNHYEPDHPAIIDESLLSDLSFHAYMLATPLCIVSSAMCDGQAEPIFCAMVTDTPVVQKSCV